MKKLSADFRSDMHPPIIVSENGDIQFYRSRREAESAIEAIDVRNGEFEIFDSMGTRLRASIQRNDSSLARLLGIHIESIVLHTTDNSDAIALIRLLQAFFLNCEIEGELPEDLSELIAIGNTFFA